jgi:hypothetical protein
VQRLARIIAKVAELQEVVTQAQEATIMVRVCAAHAKGTAREKTVLLVSARGEVVEAA